MSIWKDSEGNLHDDDNGKALGLAVWPSGLTLLTEGEVIAARAPTTKEKVLQQTYSVNSDYAKLFKMPIDFTNEAGVESVYPNSKTRLLNGLSALDNIDEVLGEGATSWKLGKWLDANQIIQDFTYKDLQNLREAMVEIDSVKWTDYLSELAKIQA